MCVCVCIQGGSIQPVDKFMIFLHGVKVEIIIALVCVHFSFFIFVQLESVGTSIKLEQSMTDRRRSNFIPVE